MKLFQRLLLISHLLVLMIPTAVLAHEKTTRVKQQNNKSPYFLIQASARSMGGLKKILAFEGIEFSALGQRFEPEQSFAPAGEFIHAVNYEYYLMNSFVARQSRTEWNNDIVYAFVAQRQFSEIINGDHGAVFGNGTLFAQAQQPMLSSRLGARVKQNLVSSPLALIHRASQFRDKIEYIGTRQFNDRKHFVVSIPGYQHEILLFIDSRTKLISKAETLEDDTVYGDTRYQVVFSDWIKVKGIKVASYLIHSINDRIINNERRSEIHLKANLEPQFFKIPVSLIAEFKTDQYSWGLRMSQWFNRLLALGLPLDIDQRSAATLDIVEVAPKVFHARAITHHSMIIEMQDYLIVADSPLYEQRSITVLNALKARWPNKPVKYLVVSHFHGDHIGGVRAYGAAGATIIIGDQIKDHFETIFKAKHTVFPDSYSLNPVDVKFKVVENTHDLVLSDGNRSVRIFDVPNRHARGMIVPLVEDVNLAFVSDLYNPELFANTIPQDFLGWAEDLYNFLQIDNFNIQSMVGAHGAVSSYRDFVQQVESSL